ncbi:MAG TPA: IS4 family transposase, partial [Deltaproteobacteria bacterium]|nr:IS4 family transposase [Deltaproteobacteria bacterium]
MNSGRTVFAQLVEFLPVREFRKCVDRYRGEYKVQRFTCLDQFLCMAFAQLTFRESLRDIETCLRAVRGKLYHMGIRGGISRTTLAKANENRDWRIFADFAQVLIRTARELYANDPFAVELEQTAYALDTTTIDLCLSVFPWAHFRQAKAAVKMHTLLDLRGNIHSFIHISDGKLHDVNILDQIIPEAGAFY